MMDERKRMQRGQSGVEPGWRIWREVARGRGGDRVWRRVARSRGGDRVWREADGHLLRERMGAQCRGGASICCCAVVLGLFALTASPAVAGVGDACYARGIVVGNPPDVVCVETSEDPGSGAVACERWQGMPDSEESPFAGWGSGLEIDRASLREAAAWGEEGSPGGTDWAASRLREVVIEARVVAEVRSTDPESDWWGAGEGSGRWAACEELDGLCVCLVRE